MSNNPDPRLDGIAFQIRPSDAPVPEGFAPGSRSWEAVLTLGEETMTVPFHTGPGLTAVPNREEVIECLASDAALAQDVDELHAIGLSPDTIAAVLRQTAEFEAFLGSRFDDVVYGEPFTC